MRGLLEAMVQQVLFSNSAKNDGLKEFKMKNVLLSDDGDIKVYSVPDMVEQTL
ncbi:hypothetical protein [Butyrivibrio sp. WCE2006]|uniref:hypothetical protein n=1 Tax=Butyrivibrio sp. WCE2006 TaxID=1410611 RepID=UPI0012DCFCED